MVLMALQTMYGGELFVKKIPSMRMTDLAQAISPDIKMVEVGIRPGEKIHEVMITREDARNTIELDQYYIVKPEFGSILKNASNLINGTPVSDDFEYHSGNNDQWLSIDQMQTMIEDLCPELGKRLLSKKIEYRSCVLGS